jgi:MFS family permease
MTLFSRGLFPGIVFVFSMYYKRSERHWRVAVFFGGAALAGAFGGVLAWALGHVTGGGLKPWGWIFAIEGIFTTVVGLTAYFWVPGYPRQATVRTSRP